MHLHIDCHFGIAGDMLLAALIDAGAGLDAIRDALENLPLRDFTLSAARTSRGGIAAMLLDVEDLTERGGGRTHDPRLNDDHVHDRGHDHAHNHDHDHDHNHDHDHGHGHSHPHPREHAHREKRKAGPHRHLGDLLNLLEGEAVSARARERASGIFRILAQAEATVHGMPVDQVHFHEISGIDTAVDVIGVCIALDLLDIDSVSAAAPSVGSGMIMCEHGIFPVPAPATLEILKSRNIPWRSGGDGERATPTGVALAAGLAETFGDSPEITVTRIGYGAGRREYSDVPNLLRVIIGKPGKAEPTRHAPTDTAIVAEPERETSGEMVKIGDRETLLPAEIAALLPGAVAPEGDRIVEFRFTVDDMTPEALAYLCEKCFAAGALEAYAIPAIMKKGRGGHEVVILSSPDLAGPISDMIWRESSTFGMRVGERSRIILARDTRTVSVLGQKIRIKLGWLGGKIIRRAPEYEDCRAAAMATGKPLGDVFALAVQAASALH